MNDFVQINIASSLDEVDLARVFSGELSDFNWRLGDSDLQGKYISGTNSDGIQLKCWTSENPLELSISFRMAALRLDEKEKILARIIAIISSHIGEIVKMSS